MPQVQRGPELPLTPSGVAFSLQQVSWNGRVMLNDLSDDGYKRLLGRLLGMDHLALEAPRWSVLLEELRKIAPRERRALLLAAVRQWRERRTRFLTWWAQDLATGGRPTGLGFLLPEMFAELLSLDAQLEEWGLNEDIVEERALMEGYDG